MNLLDSLLDAIVRLEGDALVMHVGEKPYVVTTTSAMSEFRGPLLWGHVDLSSRVLTSEAVLGLLGQILPLEQRQALQELGAIEHQIEAPEKSARFSVIAARAGDEVWVEVRRRPKVAAAAAVEQPVVEDRSPAAEPVVEPQELALVEPAIEPSIDVPFKESVDAPIEEPLYLADTIEAVEQFAVVEPGGVVKRDEIEAARFDELEPANDEREEERTAPFEIVHDVIQDSPTHADVDVLLAETAAALLRSAAPTVEREPLDMGEGAWLELERQSEAVTIEAEAESVAIIEEPDPFAVAEAAHAVVAAPMALASQVDSIAIAPELELIGIAPELEHVPLMPSTVLGPAPPTLLDPMLSTPVAFEEEFALGLDEELRLHEATALVPEPVAVLPQFELVLVGASASFKPVAYAEDFRLVAPDALVAQPLGIELDPEPVTAVAEAQAELFTFGEDIGAMEAIAPEPEPVVVAAAAEFDPIAFAEAFAVPPGPQFSTTLGAGHRETTEFAPIPPAPEPVSTDISTEGKAQPVYSQPESVAGARQSDNLHDGRQPPVTAPASRPPSEPQVQPERAVIVPLAERLPAVPPRHHAGGAKVGPVRQDQTPSTTAHGASEFSIDELLRAAVARHASTVYLVAQSRPMVRAEGDISVLDMGGGVPLEESDIARLIQDLAPAAALEAWQRGASAEWMCDVADVRRVRCMTFRDHRGPGLIFRMIPPQAISAEHLGLTQEVQALCAQSDGLVLVTGPRASGKSTLMSAFVDLINATRSDHVITIESQIEFVHESRRSFISQREVRGGDEAVVSAIHSALREDPDVVFIGDLSSPEVAAAALDVAESGRLVFASLPAASTVAAIDRLLELLPADRSPGRGSIAASLRGVVAQVLVGRTRGGRVAAREVLLNTAAVAGLIEEAKTGQLALAMESGRRHGMMPLNDALAALVRDGTVHVTEAYRKAFDKESFLAAVRQEGVDTSFAEKIA